MKISARVILQPTDIAWIVLGLYVLGCNITLREQLSCAMDRYLQGRRCLTECVLLAIYIHLSNRLPARYDPIHWLFVLLLKLLRRAAPTP